MKNYRKIIGTAFFIIVIGIITASCNTGKLVITDIPENFNGKYVTGLGVSSSSDKNIALHIGAGKDGNKRIGGIVKNGAVTLNVWEAFNDGNKIKTVGYKGSDDITFYISYYNTASLDKDDLYASRSSKKTTFKKGKSVMHF